MSADESRPDGVVPADDKDRKSAEAREREVAGHGADNATAVDAAPGRAGARGRRGRAGRAALTGEELTVTAAPRPPSRGLGGS